MDTCTPSLSFFEAIKKVFCTPSFRGRARRSEFWWFTVFCSFLLTLIDILAKNLDWSILSLFLLLCALILVYFELNVNVRRFHDIGFSGWWLFLYAVIKITTFFVAESELGTGLNIIGHLMTITILVICAKDGKEKINKYGISPKYSVSEMEIQQLNDENADNMFSFMDKIEDACGCALGSIGCIVHLGLGIFIFFGLALWLCRVDPNVTYTWYSGIWHGLFIIPNWIMHLFNDNIYYKAELYSSGYNIWWWIVLIWQILGFLGGGSSR